MALILSKTRKGRGLKFETGVPKTTFGLSTLKLNSLGAPLDFLQHELEWPIVKGERFLFDQEATNSCVLNATLHGVILKEHRENLRREGLPFEEPSRLYGYYNARRETGDHLIDGGTYIYAAGVALRKHGCCPERDWTWSQMFTKVNRRPNWNATRHAHPRRGGKYVRIFETGSERTRAIQTAILNGHDVVFGTLLGKDFQGDGAEVIERPSSTDQTFGAHAMLIIGWRTIAGRLWFRVVNSWGDRWGDHGLCWLSEEYIKWDFTQDLHVIYGWERLSSHS